MGERTVPSEAWDSTHPDHRDWVASGNECRADCDPITHDTETLAEVRRNDEHDHGPAARLLGDAWCIACEHTHIATIPSTTFRCSECGFGCWGVTVAAAHAGSYSEHVVYPVLHQMVPLAARIAQARAGEGALREELRLLRDRVTRVAEAIHGDSGWEHNGGCEGEPDCFACIEADLRAALDTPAPAGLSGYFVHPDGFGAPVIWHGTGPDDPTCRPILEGWRVQAVAPDLWTAIAALVEGKP